MPLASLSTELKQLRGTYRADRANPKEPKLPKQEPPMPRHFSALGRRHGGKPAICSPVWAC
jgi:hypothetical protein